MPPPLQITNNDQLWQLRAFTSHNAAMFSTVIRQVIVTAVVGTDVTTNEAFHTADIVVIVSRHVVERFFKQTALQKLLLLLVFTHISDLASSLVAIGCQSSLTGIFFRQ